ncbi:MAG: ROK family protein [Reyranella sp.]|nr:ROK family protein [Reyranella sp.]
MVDVGHKLTLGIDIGGTGLKAAIVGDDLRMLTDRVRMETPVGAPPTTFVEALVGLVTPLGAFDRVAVGFPGVVRNGRVLSAANLGNDKWIGFDLAQALETALAKPVRVANDADLQGLAVIAGKGVEMVITLGTGFGTGLYRDGQLAPHLEIAHHPFRHGETYDEQLGNATRKVIGGTRWNKRVEKAIGNMRRLTSFDHLYIGGGNAKKITFTLAADITIVSNEAGMEGGVKLWRD